MAKDTEMDDFDICLAAVRKYSHNFKLVSDRLKNNKEFVVECLQIDGDLFQLLPDNMRNDKSVFEEATKNGRFLVQYAGPDIRKDRNLILLASKNDISALKYASDDIQHDRAFIIKVLEKNSQTLNFLSPPLNEDLELIMKGINSNYHNFHCASDSLKNYIMHNEYELFVKIIAKTGFSFKMLPDDIRDKLLHDESSLISISLSRPYILEKKEANSLYKDNKEFFLKAVKADGLLLKYASDTLKDDDELVNEAIKNCKDAIEYASPRLKNNKKNVLKALKNTNCPEDVMRSLTDNLLDDEDVIYTAIISPGIKELGEMEYNIDLIKFASDRLKNSPEFILKLIKKIKFIDGNGTLISESLRDNEQFMLEIKKIYGNFAKDFCSDRVRNILF